MADEADTWRLDEDVALFGSEGAHGEWRPDPRARHYCREAGTQDGDPEVGDP